MRSGNHSSYAVLTLLLYPPKRHLMLIQKLFLKMTGLLQVAEKEMQISIDVKL